MISSPGSSSKEEKKHSHASNKEPACSANHWPSPHTIRVSEDRKSTKKIQPERRNSITTYLAFPCGVNSIGFEDIIALAPEV